MVNASTQPLSEQPRDTSIMGYGSTIATAMFFIVMTAGLAAITVRRRKSEDV